MKNKVLCLFLVMSLILTGCKKISDGGDDKVVFSDALSNTSGEAVTGRQDEEKGYEKITYNGKIKVYDKTGAVVAGKAGYELYNYVPSVAKSYGKTIDKASKLFSKSVNVYDIIIPTNIGITFPDNKINKVNSSNQSKSIKKIFKYIKSDVKKISLYDTLMKHRKEYLYFRTDYHWTGLGAYYAYRKYCDKTERIPHEIDEYDKKSFGKFVGSIYFDTKKNKSLKADKLYAYIPLGKKTLLKYKNGSEIVKTSVINDSSNYGVSMKYQAFIGGDRDYSVLVNPDIRNKSACVVIKESYGNAFVPYLTDHYNKVYVIDYRYWSGKLSKLVKDKKIQDVIFINNIGMTRNAYLVGQISKIVQ